MLPSNSSQTVRAEEAKSSTNEKHNTTREHTKSESKCPSEENPLGINDCKLASLHVGTSVLKIEIEESHGTLYEVVTAMTDRGRVVTWKSPIVVKVSTHSREKTYRVRHRCRFDEMKLKDLVKFQSATKVSKDSSTTTLKLQEKLNPPAEREESTSLAVFKNCFKQHNYDKQSCSVTIEHLSRSTSSADIEKLAKEVGTLIYFSHNHELGRADMKFSRPAMAFQFYNKFYRKMIDLSIIRVSLL